MSKTKMTRQEKLNFLMLFITESNEKSTPESSIFYKAFNKAGIVYDNTWHDENGIENSSSIIEYGNLSDTNLDRFYILARKMEEYRKNKEKNNMHILSGRFGKGM